MKKILRIFNLAVILTVSISLPINLLQIKTYAKTQAQINSEIASINQTLTGINKDLGDVSTRKDSLAEEVSALNEEIATTQKAIDSSNTAIGDLDKKIAENNTKVEALKAEMKEILKELQTQKGVSKVQNILAAQNLGDVLSRMYTLSSAQTEADKIKEEIETTTLEIENNKKKQEELKAASESSKVIAESKKGGVEQLLEQFKGKEEEYAKQTKELKEREASLNAEGKLAQAEYRKQQIQSPTPIIAAVPPTKAPSLGGNMTIGSGGCGFEERRSVEVPSGFFIFPTRGYTSQSFHCGHDALDIAGGSGTPILSSAPGVIEGKGSFTIAGFGNWVAVRHTLPSGQQLVSLYAHMITASPLGVGTPVSQGQQIGGMGCTGSCTGTHVHFMIYSDSYRNGSGCLYGGGSKCYNPLKFL